MSIPVTRPADAALTRAAAILNRGHSLTETPPEIFSRLMTKAGQPLETMFGSRQKQFNQAIYDAMIDLSAAILEMKRETSELRTAIHELRAVTEPIHCRPNTHDAAIWSDVGLHDEYQLPSTFLATDVIIDIGAHIGGFSSACLFRGAGQVYSFEAEAGNYAAARNNLNRFGRRAILAKLAVWRSDGVEGPVFFAPSDDPQNTGGGGVLGSEGVAVESIPLDRAIDEALQQTGQSRIRLLKLDCEGSEYPILLTSRRLDVVNELCGEYHEPITPIGASRVGDHVTYDRQTVKDCLERHGFTVELKPHPKNQSIGLFFARRPSKA